MSRARLRYWGSALGVALGFALLAALLLPFEWLGLGGAPERQRAWLLTVWTAGVMSVLFGLSALLGAGRSLGLREVKEAGSVRAALEMRQRASGAAREGWRGGAGWLVATGLLLLAVYFAGWLILRS